MDFAKQIEASLQYLNSSAALKSLAADPYWPKWDSPWWHMSVLHEMGQTEKIPKQILTALTEAMNRYPLKLFPIHAHEMPSDIDPYRGTPCHCQLGNVYQVLAHAGVDVDKHLPWIRPWFLKYQMDDGGLNCDNDAYLVKNETPSSMVGTISGFEAILLYTPRDFTAAEKLFLEKGAKFLIDRRLLLGSTTTHNADERESAKSWTKLCFPRFYLYDSLRGLTAILRWSQKTGGKIPIESIRECVTFLKSEFPDGQIRVGRQSYEGAGTILQKPDSDEWIRRQPATLFPLLTDVSRIGDVSPFLTRQWHAAKIMIQKDPDLQSLL